MPAPDRPHLLILGGTTEAIRLADAAQDRFGDTLAVTTSLAGRTRTPGRPAGAMRIGGFGGPEGLAEWLRANTVSLVVDATHPFAATISANARKACEATEIPRLLLGRPLWTAEPGDDWRCVGTLEAAAALLPDIAERVFLSVGSQALEAFAGLDGVHLVARMIDPPAASLPLADYCVVLGRGPFTESKEYVLLRDKRIDTIVSRNSGGAATYAKIRAARRLGLPVVMIAPPPRESGTNTESLEDALQWIAGHASVSMQK